MFLQKQKKQSEPVRFIKMGTNVSNATSQKPRAIKFKSKLSASNDSSVGQNYRPSFNKTVKAGKANPILEKLADMKRMSKEERRIGIIPQANLFSMIGGIINRKSEQQNEHGSDSSKGSFESESSSEEDSKRDDLSDISRSNVSEIAISKPKDKRKHKEKHKKKEKSMKFSSKLNIRSKTQQLKELDKDIFKGDEVFLRIMMFLDQE